MKPHLGKMTIGKKVEYLLFEPIDRVYVIGHGPGIGEDERVSLLCVVGSGHAARVRPPVRMSISDAREMAADLIGACDGVTVGPTISQMFTDLSDDLTQMAADMDRKPQ